MKYLILVGMILSFVGCGKCISSGDCRLYTQDYVDSFLNINPGWGAEEYRKTICNYMNVYMVSNDPGCRVDWIIQK